MDESQSVQKLKKEINAMYKTEKDYLLSEFSHLQEYTIEEFDEMIGRVVKLAKAKAVADLTTELETSRNIMFSLANRFNWKNGVFVGVDNIQIIHDAVIDEVEKTAIGYIFLFAYGAQKE